MSTPTATAPASTATPITTSITTTSTTSTTPSTSTTSTSTTRPRPRTTSSTTTSTSTSTTSTTLPGPNPAAPALRATFATLAAGNLAASLTVLLDGQPLVQIAAGSTNGGGAVTTDTPMVVASVSKLVTALTVARLVQQGLLSVDQFVPWEAMGFAIDPAWSTVTVRDLLDHTSGIPIARKTWLDDPGPCAVPLAAVLVGPPSPERGTWVYSNGNYCALGLLVELVTGERYDAAAYRLVLTPAGVTGPHLTVDGAGPDDAPYAKGVARFDRLGGAGQWMASTDDVAALLAADHRRRPRRAHVAGHLRRPVRLGPHRLGRRRVLVRVGDRRRSSRRVGDGVRGSRRAAAAPSATSCSPPPPPTSASPTSATRSAPRSDLTGSAEVAEEGSDVFDGAHGVVEVGAGADADEVLADQRAQTLEREAGEAVAAGLGLDALDPRAASARWPSCA